MNRKIIFIMVFTFALGCIFPLAWTQPQVPPPPTQHIYVQDYGHVISPETQALIQSTSEQLQHKTKAQIVVVTIDSTNDQPIEEYALAILREWGIGDKKLNNGALLLVAVQDRKMRIEIGYGLEGALPDGKTGYIRDTYILPYFKQGNFDQGIKEGYLALVQETAREYQITIDTETPTLPPADVTDERDKPSSPGRMITILIIVIILSLIFGRRRRGGPGGWGDSGGWGGGGGWSGGGGSGGGFGGGSGGGGGSSGSW